MYARALGTIGIGMVIPLIGIAAAQASFGALTGAPAGPAEFFYFRPTAAQAELACATRSAASALCGEIDRIAWLRQASVWSAAALVLVIAVFLTLAAIAGASRRLNATLFPPLMPLTTLAVAALVFVHGAIITYCVYLFEIANFGQSYWWAPAIVGGGALLGATSLLATLRSANRDAPQPVLGRAVGREDAPKLWAHVDGLADALGAEKPTNILVGLEPTFFATAAPVATPERPEPLDGETLYLSLPLLRLFTKAELNAVLGHELGHFRGGDTDYSMRFAPVYRSLVKAIHALEGDDGRVDWVAAIPGSMILKLMLEAFGRNERRISRDREFEADRAGLEVSNAEGLGLSLAKVAVYAPSATPSRPPRLTRFPARLLM
ncbi:MAG: M48 family metalloprotease [Pseudomonadota bacterium]